MLNCIFTEKSRFYDSVAHFLGSGNPCPNGISLVFSLCYGCLMYTQTIFAYFYQNLRLLIVQMPETNMLTVIGKLPLSLTFLLQYSL